MKLMASLAQVPEFVRLSQRIIGCTTKGTAMSYQRKRPTVQGEPHQNIERLGSKFDNTKATVRRPKWQVQNLTRKHQLRPPIACLICELAGLGGV